jgi:hypothetical protein
MITSRELLGYYCWATVSKLLRDAFNCERKKIYQNFSTCPSLESQASFKCRPCQTQFSPRICFWVLLASTHFVAGPFLPFLLFLFIYISLTRRQNTDQLRSWRSSYKSSSQVHYTHRHTSPPPLLRHSDSTLLELTQRILLDIILTTPLLTFRFVFLLSN